MIYLRKTSIVFNENRIRITLLFGRYGQPVNNTASHSFDIWQVANVKTQSDSFTVWGETILVSKQELSVLD